MRAIVFLLIAAAALVAEVVIYALGDSISSRLRGPVLTAAIVVAAAAVIIWLALSAK